MRWLLILLGIAGALVLTSPTFWSIWRMKTSSERVGYGEADGTVRWAQLGPDSPWPEWALVPAGTTIKVKAAFEANAKQPAIGIAEIEHPDSAAQLQRDYIHQLEGARWQVQPSYLDTALPDVPPRRVRLCCVVATKGGRSLRLSIAETPDPRLDSLSWAEGQELTGLIGSTAGLCTGG
jgi:glycogen debranching enzyme